MEIIVFSILVFSLIGYYCFYAYILNGEKAFAPITIISFITLTVYLFGCFEKTNWGCVFTLILGGVFFIFFLYHRLKKREKKESNNLNVSTEMFILIGIIWCWTISRNTVPTHFDDFSHWLRICKIMHAEGGFPCTPDNDFPHYLPGTAVWIYYITSFIGYSTSNCYFSQMFINLACCVSLFGLSREDGLKKQAIQVLFVSTLSVVLCSLNITTYALLVDGLLGLVASSLFIMIYKQAQNRDSIGYTSIMIVSIFISLVKTSGLFLVFFVALAWVFFVKPENKKMATIKCIVQAFLLTLISFFFTLPYLMRSNKIYGTHSNFGKYLTKIQSEDGGHLKGVFYKFICKCFHISEMEPQMKMIWLMLLLSIIVIIVFVHKEKAYKKRGRLIILYAITITVLYLLGLLATYMTFDESEANSEHLACFYRYVGTLTIFVSVVVITCLEEFFNNTRMHYYITVTIVMITINCFLGFDMGYIWGFKEYKPVENYTTDIWEYLSENYEEKWTYNDEPYILITTSNKKDFNDYYRLFRVLQMYFRSMRCGVYSIGDLTAEELQILSTYDQVMYFDNTGEE